MKTIKIRNITILICLVGFLFLVASWHLPFPKIFQPERPSTQVHASRNVLPAKETSGQSLLRDAELIKLASLIQNGDYTNLIDLARSYDGANGLEFWRLALHSDVPEMTKRNLLVEAIRILSKDHSPEEILQIVQSDLGPGAARTAAISYIFRFKDISTSSFASLLNKIEIEQEKKVASEHFALRFSNRRDLAIGEFQNLLTIPNFGSSIALKILSEHPTSLQGEQASAVESRLAGAISIVRGLFLTGSIDSNFLDSFSLEVSKSVPFALYSQLKAEQLFGELTDETVNQIRNSMARQDPRKFLEMALSGKNSEGLDMRPGLQQLANSDNWEANNWYEQNIGSMDTLQKSQCQNVFALSSAKQGKFTEARAWSSKILDPTLRNDAEGRIWTSERDSLRKEVGKDPSATIQALTSGQSQHADYWIEEAMCTWISKDPEKAEEWYQSNWKSLPANKSQYVASAYAVEAIKQGDTESALKWSQLIQDPKTKARIGDAISKMAGE